MKTKSIPGVLKKIALIIVLVIFLILIVFMPCAEAKDTQVITLADLIEYLRSDKEVDRAEAEPYVNPVMDYG